MTIYLCLTILELLIFPQQVFAQVHMGVYVNQGSQKISQPGTASDNPVAVLSKTATDFTPIYGYVNLNAWDIKSRARRLRDSKSSIPGVKSLNSSIKSNNESARAIPDGISPQHLPEQNNMSIEKGGVLFCPNKNIVVPTKEGTIRISSGAIVFVIASGDYLIIYDLRQSRTKQVVVVLAKERLVLDPGRMMVLTRQNAHDFKAITAPYRMITYRYAQEISLSDKLLHAFCAEFSIPEAIITVEPLNQLLNSNFRDDKIILDKIVKGAVLLNNFSGNTERAWQENIATTANAASQQY